MFMMVLSYALTVMAIFVLRHKRPDAERPYRCTGYPWLPVLYLIFSGIWTINVIVERRKESLALSGRYDQLFTYVMFMMVHRYGRSASGRLCRKTKMAITVSA